MHHLLSSDKFLLNIQFYKNFFLKTLFAKTAIYFRNFSSHKPPFCVSIFEAINFPQPETVWQTENWKKQLLQIECLNLSSGI
jgi:hypothetical protein